MTDNPLERAKRLHERCFVFDALTYLGDGTAENLLAGGVNATNITVPRFESDWSDACQSVSDWLDRCRSEESPWVLIETGADFARTERSGAIGIVMGWQNMRPIEDSLDRIGFFHKLGVRIMQPTYNYRNMLGNGCLEPEDEGLSRLGRDAVKVMNEHGIAMDLSHVGVRTTLDAIDASRQPVLVTHANAYALTPVARNKSDDVIKAVAEKGGLVGASIYGPMLWDGRSKAPPTLDDYLAHVEHIVEIAGIDHVGFGTDFPAVEESWLVSAGRKDAVRVWEAILRYGDAFGASIADTYPEGVDTQADFPVITARMLERGWSEDDISAYLGANFRRVLGQIWGG